MPKHRHPDATIAAPRDTSSDHATESDAARMLVSRRILILANVLKRAAGLRYRRLLDLAPGEWGLIAEVGVQAPQSLNALSNNLGLDKTQLSKSVSRLVARGLLSRRIKPDNNREVLISLTAKGELYFQKIVEAGRAANDALLSELPAGERQRFIAAIDDMTTRARALLQVEQSLGAVTDDPSDDGETIEGS